MQLDDITLTADDHGAGRAAVERPPLPVDPARAARDADGAASELVALLHSGPDQIVGDLGDQDVPARAGRIEAPTEADAAASLAAIGRDTIGFSGRRVLWPLLIGAKRKEQP
jgi:hypothetical protein